MRRVEVGEPCPRFPFAREAVADVEATGNPSEYAAEAPPIVTVTVRGGLIEDLEATISLDAVVEDWDVADYDTGKKPARNVWKLDASLSGPRVKQLRRLIAND